MLNKIKTISMVAFLVLTYKNVDAIQVVTPFDSKIDSIGSMILYLLNGAEKIILPLLVLAWIYVGFLFVSSQGDSNKLIKAKTALWNVLIGSFIVIISVSIYEIILYALNK
jgi:hypothetical protein